MPIHSDMIHRQFPAWLRERQSVLIDFLVAYYKKLDEESKGIFELDVDYVSRDEILELIRTSELPGVPNITSSDIRTIIKFSNDLYQAKGSQQGIDLFFRAVYGENAKFNDRARDVLRLNDADWYRPEYIEVQGTNVDYLLNLGKRDGTGARRTITGSATGATAFVESVVRRVMENGNEIHLIYISGTKGEFLHGERINLVGELPSKFAPSVVGSLNGVAIHHGGTGFLVGDVFDVVGGSGEKAQALVKGVSSGQGILNYEIGRGGFGYAIPSDPDNPDETEANVRLSEKNIQTGPFAYHLQERGGGEYGSLTLPKEYRNGRARSLPDWVDWKIWRGPHMPPVHAKVSVPMHALTVAEASSGFFGASPGSDVTIREDTGFLVNGSQTIVDDLTIAVEGTSVAIPDDSTIRIGASDFTLDGAVSAGAATSLTVDNPTNPVTLADNAQVDVFLDSGWDVEAQQTINASNLTIDVDGGSNVFSVGSKIRIETTTTGVFHIFTVEGYDDVSNTITVNDPGSDVIIKNSANVFTNAFDSGFRVQGTGQNDIGDSDLTITVDETGTPTTIPDNATIRIGSHEFIVNDATGIQSGETTITVDSLGTGNGVDLADDAEVYLLTGLKVNGVQVIGRKPDHHGGRDGNANDDSRRCRYIHRQSEIYGERRRLASKAAKRQSRWTIPGSAVDVKDDTPVARDFLVHASGDPFVVEGKVVDFSSISGSGGVLLLSPDRFVDGTSFVFSANATKGVVSIGDDTAKWTRSTPNHDDEGFETHLLDARGFEGNQNDVNVEFMGGFGDNVLGFYAIPANASFKRQARIYMDWTIPDFPEIDANGMSRISEYGNLGIDQPRKVYASATITEVHTGAGGGNRNWFAG